MKWSPSPDENGKWRLEHGPNRYDFAQPLNGIVNLIHVERIATVTSLNADNKHPSLRNLFAASVGYRSSGKVFVGLKAAQLWCEQEIRLMEVGELA